MRRSARCAARLAAHGLRIGRWHRLRPGRVVVPARPERARLLVPERWPARHAHGAKRPLGRRPRQRTGEPELARLLFIHGDEPQARAIARAIVAARQSAPITTTGALAAHRRPRQRRSAGAARPGDADLPGIADRGERRDRRARARAGGGGSPVAAGRSAGRGLVPFRRGHPGQALREPARRPAGAAVAPSAAGGHARSALALGAPGRDQAQCRRDRSQPAGALGSPAGSRAPARAGQSGVLQGEEEGSQWRRAA